MAENTKKNAISNLEKLIFGISGLVGTLPALEKFNSTMDLTSYLTNPLPLALMTGLVATGVYGPQEGIKRSSIVYAGYLCGETIIEIVKYYC